MGLIAGGYILEFARAKEWADKRYPGAIKWRSEGPTGCSIHIDINDHLNLLYGTDAYRCIIISLQGEAWLFFLTIWRRSPHFTRQTRKYFRENDYARSLKADWFEPLCEELPHLKDIRFVTVYDPFGREPN